MPGCVGAGVVMPFPVEDGLVGVLLADDGAGVGAGLPIGSPNASTQ